MKHKTIGYIVMGYVPVGDYFAPMTLRTHPSGSTLGWGDIVTIFSERHEAFAAIAHTARTWPTGVEFKTQVRRVGTVKR